VIYSLPNMKRSGVGRGELADKEKKNGVLHLGSEGNDFSQSSGDVGGGKWLTKRTGLRKKLSKKD